jgi:hypothetical protein
VRVDMSTREWHELVRPVLPHILADADLPELADIRIEVGDRAVCAIATDRYTLAAERHDLAGGTGADALGLDPVHVRGSEVAASLKLFPYSKDYDPPLRLIIDTVPFPVTVVGKTTRIRQLAVTVESHDGTRLVLHDHRDVSRDPFANWRKNLARALTRPMTHAGPALYLNAAQLGRWGAACRKGERLAVFTGTEGDDLVLICVEKHFIGAWKPVSYLDKPEVALAESPWLEELDPGALFRFGGNGSEPDGGES